MTIIVDGAPVAVVPASSNVCIEEEIGYRRYDDFTESSEIYDALIAVADPSLVDAILEMRAACEAAAKTFRWYEELHAAKGPEHADKAARNRVEAEKLEAVLARVTTGETSDAG